MKKIASAYVSIICSALLLAASFFWPQYFWWAVFVFLVPLLFSFMSGWQPTMSHGLLWGMLYFGLHWIALAEVLVRHAQVSKSVVLCCYFFLICYMSLYSLCWFWLLGLIKKITHNIRLQILFFVGISYLYFHVLYYHSLFIFGVHTGYSLGNIVLPILTISLGRWLLMIMGMTGTILFIISINGVIAYAFFLNRKKIAVYLSLLVCTLLFGITFYKTQEKNRNYMSHNSITYVKPSLGEQPRDVIQETITAIQKVKIGQRDTSLIVMPESTFSFDITPRQIQMIQDNLDETTFLLFGCYYQNKNSILCVNKERIIFHYDKTTYHPFSEILYWPWNYFEEKGWLPYLFLNGKEQIMPRSSQEQIRILPINENNYIITPAICSDLFFNTRVKIDKKSEYILFLCNDSWFSYSYFRHLMYLYAVYTAIINQIPVLYVAHTYATYINQAGESRELLS